MKYKSPLRRMLERKILEYMEPAGRELGRGELRRILLDDEAQMQLKYKTIKVIFDMLMDDGKIECVNPGDKTGLRFRLKMNDELYSFCVHCDGDVAQEECARVNNNYECPKCGEILPDDSFSVIVESNAPAGLTY